MEGDSQDRDDISSVTAEQVDAILPFLEEFAADGFSAGSVVSQEGTFPWYKYEPIFHEFIHALYDNGWVLKRFDWGNWQDEAQEYLSSSRLGSANAITIAKLFTTHVRKDRFCEGHLAQMFEIGHIVALLRRLKVIREGMT